MLHIVLIGVVAAVVILLVVVAMQSEKFTVSRSAVIQAPAASVFPHVNDLRRWEAWSPWDKMDLNAKRTLTGPPSGVDASMAWAGNNKVGEGRMTIMESRPNELVRLKLEFFKPMKATNEGLFVFKGQGSQTEVIWSMSGKKNFVGKAFHLFVDCDKMIGGQFAEGLASMKAIAEAEAKG